MTLPVDVIELQHLGTVTNFPDATIAIQNASGQNRLIIAVISTNAGAGKTVMSASIGGVNMEQQAPQPSLSSVSRTRGVQYSSEAAKPR